MPSQPGIQGGDQAGGQAAVTAGIVVERPGGGVVYQPVGGVSTAEAGAGNEGGGVERAGDDAVKTEVSNRICRPLKAPSSVIRSAWPSRVASPRSCRCPRPLVSVSAPVPPSSQSLPDTGQVAPAIADQHVVLAAAGGVDVCAAGQACLSRHSWAGYIDAAEHHDAAAGRSALDPVRRVVDHGWCRCPSSPIRMSMLPPPSSQSLPPRPTRTLLRTVPTRRLLPAFAHGNCLRGCLRGRRPEVGGLQIVSLVRQGEYAPCRSLPPGFSISTSTKIRRRRCRLEGAPATAATGQPAGLPALPVM